MAASTFLGFKGKSVFFPNSCLFNECLTWATSSKVMLPLTCSWDGLGNTWNWHKRPKTGVPKLTWKILGELNQLHLLIGSSITWN